MTPAEVQRVLVALDVRGVRATVGGGWGIDALLGRQTRAHGDLDLAVPADRLTDALVALDTIGYREVLDQRPARLVVASPRGHVDLHPVAFDEHGRGTQPGLDGQTFVYPPGSLDAVGAIGGRPVRCATPQLQLDFHVGYTPREHDRADMAALADRFGLELPEPYR